MLPGTDKVIDFVFSLDLVNTKKIVYSETMDLVHNQAKRVTF